MLNHGTACRASRVTITAAMTAMTVLVLVLASLTACGPKKGSGGCVFVRPKIISVGLGIAQAPAVAQPEELPKPRPKPPKPTNSKEKKERKKNCTKQNSPVWNGFKPYRNGVRTNGEEGKEARFYEWDHTHNDIEVYGPKSSKYKHLGSMDPSTGKMYKEAVSGRNLKDKLR